MDRDRRWPSPLRGHRYFHGRRKPFAERAPSASKTVSPCLFLAWRSIEKLRVSMEAGDHRRREVRGLSVVAKWAVKTTIAPSVDEDGAIASNVGLWLNSNSAMGSKILKRSN